MSTYPSALTCFVGAGALLLIGIAAAGWEKLGEWAARHTDQDDTTTGA